MFQMKRSELNTIWRLIKPYWVSEDKKKGWLLLVTIIGLALGQVYIAVLLNKWNADFYNALQDKNLKEFLHQLGFFTLLAAVYIAVAVYRQYFGQMLHMYWRKWMTERFQAAWLANYTYYRLQVIYKSTDNPDQRIADDVDGFASGALSLGIGLLSAVVTLVSFVTILWNLSGTLTFAVAGYPVSIPGYMVWAALFYSIMGTWITHKIGRPLVGLNYDQQRFEANFRFSMIRLRENAEAVAFYKGENIEQESLRRHFSNILQNWWQIMKKQKQLTWFTSGYGQIATIFPVIVAAPRYFSGAIPLGGLMQTASAFGRVQESLSWLVDVYPQYASWKATVDRLSGFAQAIDNSDRENVSKQIIFQIQPDKTLAVDQLTLFLPNGAPLVRNLTINLNPGDRLVLTGPSGSGKTTFLRAVAGMWPYGQGTISIPNKAKLLFIPQKPYLPILSLKEIICYPHSSQIYGDAGIIESLTAVGLERLVPHLHALDNWAQSLSPGEQQKLAFVRALLQEPNVLLLDEVTASMDKASEASLYEMLVKRLPDSIIISVAHQESLMKWHNKSVTFADLSRDTPN